MNKKMVMAVVFSMLISNSVYAASEANARALVEKAGFTEGIRQYVKNFGGGMPKKMTERVMRAINFKQIENEYVKGIAAQMTDSEVDAMIKAYDIPGYKTALMKQSRAMGPALNALAKDMQRVMKQMAKKPAE